MGLLKNNEDFSGDEYFEDGADVYVKDCVGKVGHCPIVTDAKTGEISRNTTLVQENSNTQNQNLKQNDENLSDETLARALTSIIKKLDFIIKALSEK